MIFIMPIGFSPTDCNSLMRFGVVLVGEAIMIGTKEEITRWTYCKDVIQEEKSAKNSTSKLKKT